MLKNQKIFIVYFTIIEIKVRESEILGAYLNLDVAIDEVREWMKGEDITDSQEDMLKELRKTKHVTCDWIRWSIEQVSVK